MKSKKVNLKKLNLGKLKVTSLNTIKGGEYQDGNSGPSYCYSQCAARC